MNRISFIACAVFMIGSLVEARPEVVFAPETEVSSSATVRVLEAAELKDFSPEAFQEISKFVLWEAGPTAEESTTLSRSELSKKLRDLVASSAVLKVANPAFKIPDSVKLQFSKTGVSRISTERAFRNVLTAKCAECAYKMKISSVPTMRTNTWIIDYDQEVKNGAFLLSVNDLQSTSTQWISGSVNTKKKVPVLKRTLRFGERLQSEDVEFSGMDITFQRERTPELKNVVGSIAARSLQAGIAIAANDFKNEPAARRGQILKALIGDDQFEVSVNVTAEENGSVGDTIKVQNSETKKMMSAVILEKGVVKVQ